MARAPRSQWHHFRKKGHEAAVHPGPRRGRRPKRIKTFYVAGGAATGAEKANSSEHVMYHRLLDFWGDW
jgi:hypothetical protein